MPPAIDLNYSVHDLFYAHKKYCCNSSKLDSLLLFRKGDGVQQSFSKLCHAKKIIAASSQLTKVPPQVPPI